MSECTVFPNAPITEALIDIRVVLPKDIELVHLEALYDSIKTEFPQKEQRVVIKSQIEFNSSAEKSAQATTNIDGFLFRSIEFNKLVQYRLDGFTFNKFKPYSKWELFVKEAHELWDLYKKVTNPEKVIRIGLRYINRIEIPVPLSFEEYILNMPKLPPKLPQELSNYFVRFVVPYHKVQAEAIIMQTIQNPTNEHKLPFIFDIDVYKETVYETDSDKIWEDFENFRNIKNDIFFNSITDKTKEMFK